MYLIDTPGLVDGDMVYPFNVNAAIVELAEVRARLVIPDDSFCYEPRRPNAASVLRSHFSSLAPAISLLGVGPHFCVPGPDRPGVGQPHHERGEGARLRVDNSWGACSVAGMLLLCVSLVSQLVPPFRSASFFACFFA